MTIATLEQDIDTTILLDRIAQLEARVAELEDHPAHDGGGGAIAEEVDAHDRQQVGRYIKNGCCQ